MGETGRTHIAFARHLTGSSSNPTIQNSRSPTKSRGGTQKARSSALPAPFSAEPRHDPAKRESGYQNLGGDGTLESEVQSELHLAHRHFG
jgi:hypothetical protein